MQHINALNMYMYAYIIPNQGHILVSKGGLTRNDLYDTICIALIWI